MIEVFEVSNGGHFTTSTSPVNHVYIIDVSGSMHSSLPEVRSHLKNSIGLSAKENDTFTVIWFSGRGQAGVICENLSVNDLLTMNAIHNAIDKYISPVGLTAFADPLNIANALKLKPGRINNLVMMTDGYNNGSTLEEIMSELDILPSKFHCITFIEYGFYADREMLATMAKKVGGSHLFADRIENYSNTVDTAVTSVPRVKNVDVRVNKAAKHVIFPYGGQIRIVPVEVGEDGLGYASVPADVDRVHSIVPKDVLSKHLSEDRLYLILYYAVKEGLDDLVWNCLGALGDVDLVQMYQNAFTKQELSAFEKAVELCILEPEGNRFRKGMDKSIVPQHNAPTIFNLLGALIDANAELVVSSPMWSYQRTSRASTTENVLPKFIPDPVASIPMSNIALSSERPNVSIQTVQHGVVELPENEFGLKRVPSKITRNYTLVRDGIKNVTSLPVTFDESYLHLVDTFGGDIISLNGGRAYVVFDLTRIPAINRRGLEDVDLQSLAKKVAELEDSKVVTKVLKYLKDTRYPDAIGSKSEKMASTYGEEAAKWLSSIGVRDYGFSPVGTTQVEATDEYPAIAMKISVAGFSSIPTIAKVVEKAKQIEEDVKKSGSSRKKLNLVETSVMRWLDRCDSFSLEEIEAELKKRISTSRSIQSEIASAVATLILGRKWFGSDEVATVDGVIVTDVDMNHPPVRTSVSFEKVRKMIKI